MFYIFCTLKKTYSFTVASSPQSISAVQGTSTCIPVIDAAWKRGDGSAGGMHAWLESKKVLPHYVYFI